MRRERGTRHLMMDNYSFEKVTNFECLRVNNNESTDNNEYIWLRFIAKNRRYFRLYRCFEVEDSIMWRTRVMLYKVLMSPLTVYGRGAWASARTDENKLVNGGSYTRIF